MYAIVMGIVHLYSFCDYFLSHQPLLSIGIVLTYLLLLRKQLRIALTQGISKEVLVRTSTLFKDNAPVKLFCPHPPPGHPTDITFFVVASGLLST